MSLIKNRIWTAAPLLIAYVIVVGTTIGLLVSRSAHPAAAVPALAATGRRAEENERELREPPLWLQLFRPSPPTARLLLRTALPSLSLKGNAAQERPNLLILWTGKAGDRPQTLLQVMLPFLRPQGQAAAEPAQPNTGRTASPGGGTGDPAGAAKGPTGSTPRDGGPAPRPGTEPSPGPAAGEPKPPESAVVNGGLPMVGIYHTHDYESYLSEFPDLTVSTDQDLTKIASYDHSKRTVVDIGETLAHSLRDLGVTTVHAPRKHQELGYEYAYQSSRNTAREILKAAPSVRVLLDIHRDGNLGLDSTAVIDGRNVARIRCVIGARDDQTHWPENKAFCDALMERLEQAYPGITLPTITAQYRYNQDLMPGAILLEVGNALNRYEEADRAVRYLAEALVALIREGKYPQ